MSWWRRAGPAKAHYTLDAGFSQFHLHDDKAEDTAFGDLAKSWADPAAIDLLALAPGIIAVGTVKDGMVRVDIEVTAGEPAVDLDGWDQVVDCSIDLPSGRLLVAGCLEPVPKKIRVAAGPYRARIHYSLDSMETEEEDEEEVDDRFLVLLWPAALEPPRCLKPMKWPGKP